MQPLLFDAEAQQELVQAYKHTSDKRLCERIQAALMTANSGSKIPMGLGGV